MTGRKAKSIGVLAAVLALVVLVGWYTHPLLTISLLVLVTLATVVAAWWWHRRTSSAALVGRWADKAEKHHDVADYWSVLRVASWWALRRQARVLKPSLADQSWWTRWRQTPITELGTRLIRSGRLWVMASVEEHTLTLGGPRQGKSGRLAHAIVEAPGAVMATSTGADLIRNTERLRGKIGPTHVFNPAGVGGLASTIGWDVLHECRDHRIATERATDLLSATPLAGNDRQAEWVELATQTLSALMHAAALGGRTMHRVQRWVADPDADGTIREVLGYLQSSPEPAVALQALAFFNAGRPRSSICLSISPALRWLTDPNAVAATSHGTFDVEQFLTDRATLYLLAEKNGPVAPLITALAGHVARTSRRIADRQPRERLEPPLTLVLDEAPSVCPLPLPAWTADMGKRNITMHIGAQSLSQMNDRWGANGAGTLLTNCASILVFGGTKDGPGLDTFSTLAEGAVTKTQLQQLPKLHAVVLRNGLRPVIGRPPMIWERRDCRVDKRMATWALRLATVRALVPRRAVTAKAPISGQLALPAGGSADVKHAELLQEYGLSSNTSQSQELDKDLRRRTA